MKYIFFGTPRFAEIILDSLIRAGMPPMAVVCNPDRPVGRKKIISAPPTKILAQKYNIAVFQPETLSTFDFRLSTPVDFFVVAAYAKIIPKKILAIPRLGTVGVHPSLLPKYRGASPIQSAILAGETATGVTLYLMDEQVDHGTILRQETRDMGHGTISYLALEEQLAELSAKLLVETLPQFFQGKIKPAPQDESQATFTKKFKTEDGFIDPSELAAAENGNQQKAKEILRKILALNPEPGCWTTRDGKRIKLLEAEIVDNKIKLLVTQQEGSRPKRIQNPAFRIQ